MRKTLLLGVLAALALPSASLAATEKVDATAKTATLSGTITDPAFGAYDLALFFYGGTEIQGQSLCVAPACEEHTLTVGADGAELRLTATSDADNLSLEIIDPDGTYTEVNEVETTSDHLLEFDPTPGDWTIRVYGAGTPSFDYEIAALFRTPEDVAQDPVEEEPTE
jgi:hypothetical protein